MSWGKKSYSNSNKCSYKGYRKTLARVKERKRGLSLKVRGAGWGEDKVAVTVGVRVAVQGVVGVRGIFL